MIESWQSGVQLLLVAGSLLGSGYVWTEILRKRARGLPPLEPHTRPVAPIPWGVVVGVMLWIGFQLANSLAGPKGTPVLPSIWEVQLMCGINFLIAAVLPLALATNGRPLKGFGIYFENWRRQIAVGVKAFLAAVWPTALLLLLSLPWREETQHVYLKALRDVEHVELVVWIFVSAAIAAPLAEEMLFRVTLQSWLAERLPAWLAIGGSAAIFALAHNWRDALPLLPLALILGYVFHRTRSYWACVTAHALFNAANLTMALLSEFPAAG
jgi:membrane protease YdiL (CAAX protease family)